MITKMIKMGASNLKTLWTTKMTFLSLFPTIMEKTFVAQLAQDSRWLFM
jgi:hypothetical protein